MPDSDTTKAIVANVKTVASLQGIKFSVRKYEDENIPASLLPHGTILYTEMEYEYVHGQRSGYAQLGLMLRIVIKERNAEETLRSQLEWTDKLRSSLTINALNIGKLLTSKLVSRVTTETVDVDNTADKSILNFEIFVRYREE
jgi:hypothetical protein